MGLLLPCPAAVVLSILGFHFHVIPYFIPSLSPLSILWLPLDFLRLLSYLSFPIYLFESHSLFSALPSIFAYRWISSSYQLTFLFPLVRAAPFLDSRIDFSLFFLYKISYFFRACSCLTAFMLATTYGPNP